MLIFQALLIAKVILIGATGFAVQPVPEHCGRSRFHAEHRNNHSLEERIVGGIESQSGEWPWLVNSQIDKRGPTNSMIFQKLVEFKFPNLVSMMLKRPGLPNYKHVCGGTLIDHQWVISAAHCFESIWDIKLTSDPKAWIVRIEEHDLFDDFEHHIDVSPQQIIIHPSRNAHLSSNFDIALIKLSKPVTFHSHINVVCLPHADKSPEPGTMCVTAGWGYEEEGGYVSSVVRHVQVPIVSNELCSIMYDKLADPFIDISEEMLCAGFDNGGFDACQYDSGGPLICFDPIDDEWILCGVVSIGNGCARAGFPGIYTRVPALSDWIQDTIVLN